MKAWLGLGSNLQRPVAQIRRALASLESATGIEILRTSSLYHTPPWGHERQDDFINAVVQVAPDLEPMPLLRTLQSIENEMGRRRSGHRWGPRIIDIDLLLYADLKIQSEELELPHPRMHERAFVLVPLCELDKSIRIPGHGIVEELLKTLNCDEICQLKDLA